MAKMKWMAFLLLLSAALLVLPIACDFGDDDDDDDDDNDNDDNDDDESCVDDVHDAAELYCESLGMEAQAGAGLSYSVAECGIVCGDEFYLDFDCKDGTCVCCE